MSLIVTESATVIVEAKEFAISGNLSAHDVQRLAEKRVARRFVFFITENWFIKDFDHDERTRSTAILHTGLPFNQVARFESVFFGKCLKGFFQRFRILLLKRAFALSLSPPFTIASRSCSMLMIISHVLKCFYVHPQTFL